MLILSKNMLYTIVCFLNIIVLVICQNAYKDIKISQGTVRGFNVDDDEVFSFYGIPYATVPTGDDKFKEALPPKNWTDIFYANISDIICPQRKITHYNFPTNYNKTLDCLIANIFMPNTNEKNLPVYVTVFGGAFQGGMGTLTSDIDMVKRGLVTVSFNYRVGVLGFLCLNTEFAPGNAGLKDSILALKWIKNNIEHFGGDPNNVFVHGSSSGSLQVELLMLHEGANDLFQKASKESGTIIRVELNPLEVANNFAKTFNVSTNNSIEKLEEFYKNLPDEYLNKGYLDKERMFLPCVETHNITGVQKFLTKKPIDILISGEYLPRPLLIGLTTLEGMPYFREYEKDKVLMTEDFTNFLPKDFIFDSEELKSVAAQKMKDIYFPDGEITRLGYIQYKSDSLFSFGIMTSARLHARLSEPVYLYLFTYNGTVNLPEDWKCIKSPGHTTQLLYLQDYAVHKDIYNNLTNNDRCIQKLIRDLWYNFCKYGEPLPPNYSGVNIIWPPMTPDNEIFLNIDLNLSLGVFPLKERLSVWDEYSPYTYNISNLNPKESGHKLYLIIDIIIGVIIIIIIFTFAQRQKLFFKKKLSAS